MIEVSQNIKQDLEEKFRDLLDRLTEDEKRYCSQNTLGNLVFHFDEITTEEDRAWAYLALKNYFAGFNTLEVVDREAGMKLFFNHLFKVFSYYREHIGFMLLVPTAYLLPVFFTCFVILYFVAPFWISLLPFVVWGVYYYFLYKKHHDKKLYGVFY